MIFRPDDRSGEIYMIAVHPAAQRQGIARALTEAPSTRCEPAASTSPIVATGGDPGHTPARVTYEKAGFIGAPQVWYARVIRNDEGNDER